MLPARGDRVPSLENEPARELVRDRLWDKGRYREKRCLRPIMLAMYCYIWENVESVGGYFCRSEAASLVRLDLRHVLASLMIG